MTAIPEIGAIMAASVVAFFQERNQETVQKAAAAGVNTIEPNVEPETQPLAGKVFVLTGTLQTLSRNEAAELIESQEAKYQPVSVAKLIM